MTAVTTLETKPTSKSGLRPRPRAGRTRPFRPHVIWAVFKRNFLSYFSNPAGYVFITLFVLISSWVAFWHDSFFTNNLANLDQLNRYMPYLLLFFIPAITMSSWADERRQGTDELLLTLPAHDLDVVLGKYLAALGIYTVALVFSLSQVFILRLLGAPDFGVLFADLSGLLADGRAPDRGRDGRLAAVVERDCGVHPGCLVLRGADLSGHDRRRPLAATWRRLIEDWSVPAQFQDFGTGVITLSGLFYFLGLAVAMLYLNMVLLGRRHWAGGEASRGRWLHSVVRFVAVVLVACSACTVIARASGRPRRRQRREAAHALARVARPGQADPRRPARLDPGVLQSRKSHASSSRSRPTCSGCSRNTRRGAAARSGLNLVPTELYSEQAREAEKRFGIEPRRVFTADQGKQMSAEVFLGVAFTSGVEEVVIPFFDRGLPVEYELTRSIRVVSRSGRKKVGILSTDAKLMGGMDMRTFSQTPEWSIVTELKKQYDVSSVSPDTPIPSDVERPAGRPAIVADPEADRQPDRLRQEGRRRPCSSSTPSRSTIRRSRPSCPRCRRADHSAAVQPPEPKGNLRPLLDLVGLDWPSGEIVWNAYNPHPKLADLQSTPEIVFIGKGSGAADAFNSDQIASAGLQEIVAIFPGLLRPKAGGSGPEFIPLLRTGRRGRHHRSGAMSFSRVSWASSGINPRRRHIPTGMSYTLAARLTGELPAETGRTRRRTQPRRTLRRRKTTRPQHAGEDQRHRHRRPRLHRRTVLPDAAAARSRTSSSTTCRSCSIAWTFWPATNRLSPCGRSGPSTARLEVLEEQVKSFDKKLAGGDQGRPRTQAERRARTTPRSAFAKEVDMVQSRTEWDERTKEIQLENLQRVAQRRLDVKKQIIEDEKLDRRSARARPSRATRSARIRNNVRYVAAGDTSPAAADPGHDRLDRPAAPREPGRQPEAAGVSRAVTGGWWQSSDVAGSDGDASRLVVTT